jgi:preprotein translocase subunit YajC
MFESLAWAMGGQGSGGANGGGGLTAFVPLILMFVIFYFLLIRPQQKKSKAHKEMLANINKGDTIVTQGGLMGKVTGVTNEYRTLEIAEKIRVKIARGFISAKLTPGQPAGQVQPPAEPADKSEKKA